MKTFYKIRKSDISLVMNSVDDDMIDFLSIFYRKDYDIFYIRINDANLGIIRFGWNEYDAHGFDFFINEGYKYCGDYIKFIRREKIKRLDELENRR